ncbi:glycosyltransferase family 2 protein [Terrimonas sp. NA20]|uniref:Glycosyltransferase family 2 protein n=1 Tax=Terrimonas ginsenosidimutans TaxID=2908004 RepID=A0ABS9KZ90_9BACT|nr:glycosyltransferase family 2 protein [Terrimonas ginsenosidimutans]MCG2617661.1 glycosyltransferase family 2 protein [Terrimonas ginsenosidimutans]
MKVCGFSFVRNGVKLEYPFLEAIRSILPLCDEVIVAVGKSTDDTLEQIKSLGPKITIIETVWEEGLVQGRVLAVETDKAFQAIPDKYDWCIYIQGDEVIHEKYHPVMRESMQQYLDDKKVDGFLFHYTHFFGSYAYVGVNAGWYRREIRIVRNNKEIFSYRDAQGFRKKPNDKLRVKLINAYIYHYGWVRKPEAMREKEKQKIKLYDNNAAAISGYTEYMNDYTYEKATQPVKLFTGTHPAVMQERVNAQNWAFHPDPSLKYASAKDRFKRVVGKWTGWFPGEYKNYKII